MGVVRGELKLPPDDFMESALGFETEIKRERRPVPDGRVFSTFSQSKADFYEEIVDSSPRIRRYFPAMALNAPYLPLNPLRPRAFGGKGTEGMKKQIPSSLSDLGE